jgi:tRNA dimethylallyltransferase
MSLQMRPTRRAFWPVLCSSQRSANKNSSHRHLRPYRRRQDQASFGGRQQEIISADSAQIYRGLDVGSAKPSAQEMDLLPHHLIDIVDASHDYSAGMFFRHARTATDDVLYRSRVPVVAGGTGLYLRWYISGKPCVPQSSMDVTSAVWSELASFREAGQWEQAVDLVAKAGDPKARHLSMNNCNRLNDREGDGS